MSDESAPKPLNFVLEWRGEGGERRTQSAREEFARSAEGAAEAHEAVVTPEPDVAEEPAPESFVETISEADAPELEPAPEYFEWTADRERAIQRFLEAAPEGALPTVHVQLSAIHQALKHGNLDPAQARILLDEVDGYLGRHIALEECKVPVADVAFLNARADKLKAFHAFLEASGNLREFLEGGEGVHLDVAAYAADQGSAFLAGARQVLFDAEPLEDE